MMSIGKDYLIISKEVLSAIDNGEPVIALESTIISHGMPYPKNVETALQVEQMVRKNGAIPATIAIIQGKMVVGLSHMEIELLGKTGQAVIKTSRRDIPFVIAQRKNGATTVASTMILAQMAGIRIFATGGIGGVHHGAETTMDVSADLQELASTPVAVVCAGVKSVLDIGLTLEYLETHGVPVIGYRTHTMPAFYTRSSEFSVDYTLNSATEIAKALRVKWNIGISGGAVIANPIPQSYSMKVEHIDRIIQQALTEMNEKGIKGKKSTPFLLAKIAEDSQGESLQANIQLILNNAKLASEIAVSYCKLV